VTDTGTVLVVDDTPSKRYVLSSWLRRAGHTVLEAATGTDALRSVDASRVDVVVLDVQLPDMTGFEVCERIKAAPEHAAVPVVHVSASAVAVADRTQGLTRGADAYLVEPIDPDELVATVQAALRYYRARMHAERLASRLAKLARTAVSLNTVTTPHEILRAAAAGAADIYAGPAAVYTETTDGAQLCAVADGPGAEVNVRVWRGQGFDVPVGSLFHILPGTHWPEAAWPGDGSVCVLGARARSDRAPVYIAVPGHAIDPDAPVLTQLGQAVIAAIEAIRVYAQEHQLALTLQYSLLPTRLPRVPGWQFAVRYAPASDQAEIGGDFYEISRVGERLFVAIGDVAGHSLHAATVMAELRHATRAYVAEGHPPAGVLDQLNRLMLRLIPDETATICLLEVDPGTGVVRLANAGHPPPLVVTGAGAEFVRHRTPLLGIAAPPATETTFTLDPGAALILYTDGLVERRGRELWAGLDALVAASARIGDDLAGFCDRLLVDVGPEQPDDDIAVVVLRRD
jgi:CheY-like chemotaxis protein